MPMLMMIPVSGTPRIFALQGFFSDACTPTLAAERGMKPALIIDCDIDLYISAFQCMDWMFAMKLAVAGTIVYYDDVSVIKEEAGELKARPLHSLHLSPVSPLICYVSHPPRIYPHPQCHHLLCHRSHVVTVGVSLTFGYSSIVSCPPRSLFRPSSLH